MIEEDTKQVLYDLVKILLFSNIKKSVLKI